MTTSCILCGRRFEDVQEISFHAFPENEDRRKKWLDAIGKTNAEVPTQSSLCSCHFSQSCFKGSSLTNDAVPTLKLEPYFSAEEDRLPEEESETESSMPIMRPTITKGRRIHMLSDEEMKETQPIKYVRYLKSVNWDEISKVPAEAKIVWEVAMEELKEDNEKIKHLQKHARRLNETVLKLKNALKARKKSKTIKTIIKTSC